MAVGRLSLGEESLCVQMRYDRELLVKLSDVNKSDPKHTSLDDYKCTLAFLKIPDMDIFFDDETNKQRYIFAYDFYIFLRSGLIPLVLSIIACACIFFIAAKNSNYFEHKAILSSMWPWNSSISQPLKSLGRIRDGNIVTSVTGVVSTFWLGWLAVRFFSEIKMHGSFYIPRMILVAAIVTIGTWWGASVNFIDAPSFGPMLSDNYTILSLKKFFFISWSYWATGAFVALGAPYIRFLIKFCFSKHKRNTPFE